MIKLFPLFLIMILSVTEARSQQPLERGDVVKGTVMANGKSIPALYNIWRMRAQEPYGYVRLGSDSYGLPAIDTTTAGTIVIPEEIIGPDGRRYLVKAIARQAFAYCRHVTQVVMHNRLTHIGDQAFIGCESLTQLTLPASIEMIYPCAFRNCPKLNIIRINCTRLPEVYSDIFDQHTVEQGTLFIPSGTSSLYSNTLVWGMFHHRFEMLDE